MNVRRTAAPERLICIDSDDDQPYNCEPSLQPVAPRPKEEVCILRLNGIRLTARDIALLEEEQWLNDSVVDFFLRFVLDVVAPMHLRGDVHLANTFFFQKLTSGGVHDGVEGWHNVRRWTGGDNLLAKRFLVVPINEQNMHWWLAIVCHPSRAFETTGLPRTRSKQPRIVCVDSAVEATPKARAVDFLQGYMWRELCEQQMRRSGAPANKRQKDAKDAMNTVTADVPKQANGHDCGIFVIEHLVHILKSISALDTLGLAPHRHWFGQDTVSHRRKRLSWIVAILQHEAARRQEIDVARLVLDDAQLRKVVVQAFTDQPGSREPRLPARMRQPFGRVVVVPTSPPGPASAGASRDGIGRIVFLRRPNTCIEPGSKRRRTSFASALRMTPPQSPCVKVPPGGSNLPAEKAGA